MTKIDILRDESLNFHEKYRFNFSEVSEYILRIVDYLDDQYQILLSIGGSSLYLESSNLDDIFKTMKKLESTSKSKRINIVTIHIFRK